jgi:hypothetical protein
MLRFRVKGLAAALAAAALTAFGAMAPLTAVAAGSTSDEEGVVGTDGSLFASQDFAAFSGLGGGLLGAPAVVNVPNPNGTSAGQPIFVGTGLDHKLWVRSLTQAWQPLSSNANYCIDAPAGVVVSAHAAGAYLLTVACQGSDHALWYGQELVSVGTLPPQSLTFQTLGGVLVSGPAVAAVAPIGNTVDGELTFFVDGSDGHIWTRTVSSGWSSMGWGCLGHPAVATSLSAALSVPSGQISVFACQGTDHQLWSVTNTGAGWGAAQPMGGVFIDGPGVSVGPENATFYGEGLDHQSWHRTVTYGAATTAWTPNGGTLQFGAGAAALLFQNANP